MPSDDGHFVGAVASNFRGIEMIIIFTGFRNIKLSIPLHIISYDPDALAFLETNLKFFLVHETY